MSTGGQPEVPTLFGTCGEVLSLLLRQDPNHAYVDDHDYARVEVNLEIPQTLPPFQQRVTTATYQLPGIRQLGSLLDGNSAVVFEFVSLHFRVSIYEHTWGARYAFIAAGSITTILANDFAPWPRPRELGNFILDNHPSAACLNFAFRCDYERLRTFYDQLSHSLNAL